MPDRWGVSADEQPLPPHTGQGPRVLTILGLPPGTAIGILQVLDDKSLSHLLIALALSFALAAVVLTTRYGRLVLSSLRRLRPGGTQRHSRCSWLGRWRG